VALLAFRCRAEVCGYPFVVDFKVVREKGVLTSYLVLMYFLRSYCLGMLLHASVSCQLSVVACWLVLIVGRSCRVSVVVVCYCLSGIGCRVTADW
jgi:hypothetical protein